MTGDYLIGSEFCKKKYKYYSDKVVDGYRFHSEYMSYNIYRGMVLGHPKVNLYRSIPHVDGAQRIICVGTTLKDIKDSIRFFVENKTQIINTEVSE